MAKIILDNKGIILTGEEDELHNSEQAAKNQALLLINEAPDGDDVFIWEDAEDKWHVGW